MNVSDFAINSVSTGGDTLECRLSAYRAAGFESVEFQLGQVWKELDAGMRVDRVAQLLVRSDMRCIGGFEGIVEAFGDGDSRAANRARVRDNARLVSDLGGSMLVVGTDGPPDRRDDGALSRLAEVLAQTADGFPSGVSLLIEFNWSPFVKSLRTAVEVVRMSGSERLGVLFDPAHYHCTPSKFEQLTAESCAAIRHVHVDDMRDKPGELCDCNADRTLPGNGCLDLPALFGRLLEFGYTGKFSIEMFSEELYAMPTADAAAILFESMRKLSERMRLRDSPTRPSRMGI